MTYNTFPTLRTTESTTRRCCPLRRWFGNRAFTLIELMVVIGVIAVLISFIGPTLGRTRMMAKQTREMSMSRQVMIAFTCYGGDNKSAVMVGYPSADMVNGPMVVVDDRGNRLTGEPAQRYPWRIASYFTSNFTGLYDNAKLLSDLRGSEAQYAKMGVNYPYVISLFPSLGMNIAFIGGSDKHGANDKLFQKMYGRQYISKLEEPLRPSRLLTFVSARCEEQAALPGLGKLDGFFRVDAPYWTSRKWAESYDSNAAAPETNSGYVSLRYANKAVCAAFDGHAEMLGWNDLNDMTRWSDKATSATWTLAK